MIDISKAEWTEAIQGDSPFSPTKTLRIGALFVFNGMLKEIMVTSPILQSVNEKDDELYMVFASYDATLMEGLKNHTGPAFVIVRLEDKSPLVLPWEQGYHIMAAMQFIRFDGPEIGVRMKVRRGVAV
jgi:hypothetical protein